MMQSEGEYAGSQAAAAAGIPYTLSTMGTASIEDVAAAAPDGRNWFQLYLWTDRDRSLELIERAAKAGNDTLMVTVDTAVAGARLRDVRNGMTIPPALTIKTVLDASYRPAWWFNFLTHEPLTFASLSRYTGTVADLINSMFDPTLTFDDLDWLRETWKGKLVVKGIQTVEDARRVVDHGADGIVLSNHGGRQLDRAPIPFHLLPDVKAALKADNSDAAIILDTGIMSGADIIAALALGADFTLIGRAYLYGLMAGGRAGVDRAIEILEKDMLRTMALLGVSRISELTPDHVRLLSEVARVPRVGSSRQCSREHCRELPTRRGAGGADGKAVLDEALGEHRVGHLHEAADVRAQHVVPRLPVFVRGGRAAVVDADHDLGEPFLGVLERPGVAAGVLLHFQRGGGHAAGVGGLARAEQDAGLLEDRDGLTGRGHVGALRHREQAVARPAGRQRRRRARSAWRTAARRSRRGPRRSRRPRRSTAGRRAS